MNFRWKPSVKEQPVLGRVNSQEEGIINEVHALLASGVQRVVIGAYRTEKLEEEESFPGAVPVGNRYVIEQGDTENQIRLAVQIVLEDRQARTLREIRVVELDETASV